MEKKENKKLDSLRFIIPAVAADVFSRWIDILLAGFIAAMAAFVVFTAVWTPTYSMKATYLIMTKVSTGYETYSTGSVSYTVATTFEYLTDSEILQDMIADALGEETLPGTIDAEIAEDTNIMYLTVSASSPKETYEIMTAVTDNYQNLVDIVMGSISLDLLEEPTIPTTPDNAFERRLIMAEAFLAAVVFMIILYAGLSLIRNTLKSENDFEEELGVRRLATVLKERRRMNPALLGKNRNYILINRFPVSYEFVENIEKLRTNFEYRAEKKDSRVIIITSALPNEGKSTISANLALALAKTGKKVAYIDGDLRNPSIHNALNIDREIKHDLGEFLMGSCTVNDVLVWLKNPGMHVIAGKNHYNNATELLGSGRMEKLTRELREIVDYVIIDMPPASFMIDTEEASGYADGIIFVVRQNLAPAKVLRDVLDSLDKTGVCVLGCVFNNVRALGRRSTAIYRKSDTSGR